MFEDKRKKLFLNHFYKLTSVRTVSVSRDGNALSAALLYTFVDFYNMKEVSKEERTKRSSEMLSYIDDVLGEGDQKAFRVAVELMSEVIRGSLIPRGEWDLQSKIDINWARKYRGNPLMVMMIFFGDCISIDNLIFHYTGSLPHVLELSKYLEISEDMYGDVIDIIDSFTTKLLKIY